MPEAPFDKHQPHPYHAAKTNRGAGVAPVRNVRPHVGYVELDATTNYTFLTGGSHPEELARRAAELGYPAIAVTDTHTLAGVVRAHVAAKGAGIRCIVGCRLRLVEPRGLEVLVYPTDRAAYGALCQLLTLGKRRTQKGHCTLTVDDVRAFSAGMLGIAVPPNVPLPSRGSPTSPSSDLDRWGEHLAKLRSIFDGDRLSIAVRSGLAPNDVERLATIAEMGRESHIPLVATNGVLYHSPERRALHDVLTCIRLGTTIDAAGYALEPNGERHLKAPDEMARLLGEYPRALARSVEIAERTCGFDLDQLKYNYPHEVTPPGRTPMEHLRHLTQAGARARYSAGLFAGVGGRGNASGVPEKVARLIEHELALIDELDYAPYFLTVHDLVAYARSRDILCQGRGAAANSAVCYCLGITSVDPDRANMLFERFISRERHEPPDIDIDFEHERREEVIQYIYGKYGRERAALTAEVISYRPKSAVRDVGKALGLSLDMVDKLAKTLDWWDGGVVDADRVRALGLNPEDRTLRLALRLSSQLLGFPRHLSQHVGGFVITQTPLCELVPIENARMEDRTVIEWDKDDIDAMGMLKVDCLGLGMLTCIRKCIELVRQHHGRALTLASVPSEDPVVYDMICKGDTIGVFQIESRAQMSMLPRLKPRCFYDLVIEVAIVRPGPIQGKMVHPYLRRREGSEAIAYPNEDVRRVLGRTLGVPLFQEQAMAMAIVAGGFTPGEADQLRRAMAAWKRQGDQIARFGVKLVEGMRAKGYDAEFAERCFEQIKGFSEYGFPESHAASFALLVYVSSWLKCHAPAAFGAALLNSQPMGFYQPAQIVRDAQQHGVIVRGIDVNASRWDCTLEDGGRAVRLGMRLTRGMVQAHADAIADARDRRGVFVGVDDVHRRVGVPVAALRRLARADAFQSLGLDRQGALWAIRRLRDESLPLFDGVASSSDVTVPQRVVGDADQLTVASTRDGTTRPGFEEPPVVLPAIPLATRVQHDYAAMGLSLKAHPLSFLRARLGTVGVTRAGDLADHTAHPNGSSVRVAGIVLNRQRPGTASGIVFMTLEDETGHANLIVRPAIFERDRAAGRHATILCALGRVERNGLVVHVLVSALRSLDAWHSGVEAKSRNFR